MHASLAARTRRSAGPLHVPFRVHGAHSISTEGRASLVAALRESLCCRCAPAARRLLSCSRPPRQHPHAMRVRAAGETRAGAWCARRRCTARWWASGPRAG